MKIPKMNTGDQPLGVFAEKLSEVMNLTAASVSLGCQTALVKSPTAARAALAKHRASIATELLAQALEKVGSYTHEHGRTSLHEAIIYGDAATVKLLLAAGAQIDIDDYDGATPLDLASDESSCREILKHHATVVATLSEDPGALIVALVAHCTTLSTAGDLAPSTALTLHAPQLDPSFLWTPPASRDAITAWARDACIAQHAVTVTLFGELIDDCAGDVLEFFEVTMTRTEALHTAAYCSSPEARV